MTVYQVKTQKECRKKFRGFFGNRGDFYYKPRQYVLYFVNKYFCFYQNKWIVEWILIWNLIPWKRTRELTLTTTNESKALICTGTVSGWCVYVAWTSTDMTAVIKGICSIIFKALPFCQFKLSKNENELIPMFIQSCNLSA